MSRIHTSFLAPIALAIALAGCAAYSGAGLRPGSSTADDVRRQMGPPGLELAEPAGGRLLIYPKGPLGTQTFIARVDSHGMLESIDQVLDDSHFQAIHEGQTKDEVLRLIGPPGETMRFPTGNLAWTYRYVDTWGYTSDFSVTFDPEGIVVSKIAVRLQRDHVK
ncbi:MAG TPA: hypothetical protein VEG27_13585 [Usitatibacter sp.]|nr:hypothetical protein [Usitatibacter sp.]